MHPLLAALYVATLQFAAGSLLATLLSEWRAEVTVGFLRLAAVTTLAGASLAYLLVDGAGPGEWACALGLLVGTLAYTLLQFGRARGPRLVAGGLGAVAGLAGLTLAAVARPSPLLGVGWTALASLASALALGTSTIALLLGHWYLVTPRLSARPLRRLCDLAIVALVVLTGIGLWYLVSYPEAQTVGPPSPLFRWAGLLSISLFPLGVTIAARLCCQQWPRGRAIQAATGLLYIVAALVLAGALAGNMVLLTG